MQHHYHWRMVFRESCEVLEGESRCVELTVNRNDGSLLHEVIGEVYSRRDLT